MNQKWYALAAASVASMVDSADGTKGRIIHVLSEEEKTQIYVPVQGSFFGTIDEFWVDAALYIINFLRLKLQ